MTTDDDLSPDPGSGGPRRVVLDSARLRCLAHPLRSRLLSALRLDGPATSAALADRLRTNTGATSYHLRKLAEVGLIVDQPDLGTGRERVWASAHEVTSWSETQFDDDPDDRAAAEWLLGHHLRITQRWREDFVEQRTGWSTEWRDASTVGDMRLPLTPERSRALIAELEAVVQRYADEGPTGSGSHEADASAQPVEGAGTGSDVEEVVVLLNVFPTRELRL